MILPGATATDATSDRILAGAAITGESGNPYGAGGLIPVAPPQSGYRTMQVNGEPPMQILTGLPTIVTAPPQQEPSFVQQLGQALCPVNRWIFDNPVAAAVISLAAVSLLTGRKR